MLQAVSKWAGQGPFFICGVHFRVTMGRLEDLVEESVKALGYDVPEIQISNHGKMLRVFIDKLDHIGSAAHGGITVGDCERVSRQLTRVFEVEGIDYDRLEVSSPGLDRRLRKPADFERFAGHRAEVRMRQAVGGRRRYTGTLLGMRDGCIALETDAGVALLEIQDLDRARLVPQGLAGGRK